MQVKAIIVDVARNAMFQRLNQLIQCVKFRFFQQFLDFNGRGWTGDGSAQKVEDVAKMRWVTINEHNDVFIFNRCKLGKEAGNLSYCRPSCFKSCPAYI